MISQNRLTVIRIVSVAPQGQIVTGHPEQFL
jgi:hypothetical protein